MLKVLTATTVLVCAAFCSAVWADQISIGALDLEQVQQEYGKPKTDLSVDGKPLKLGGQPFEHGLGTHAAMRLRIDLHGTATQLRAVVGFDDEAQSNADPVIFVAKGDNKPLWSSGIIKFGDPPKPVAVDLTGVQTLDLLVRRAGGGNRSTHVDWADAHIAFSGQPPVAVSSPGPGILTPPPPHEPRINGATVFGVRPGSPLLHTIPATGDRPMTFSADGLPPGVTLDPATGQLSGTITATGTYPITISARNALGSAKKTWKLAVGPTIALTPPMGWNSWNCWGESVDEQKVLRSAKAMATSGLIDHGWTYVNIDDTWQGQRGGPFNGIQPDPKRFGDMAALCDRVHALGLKIGIYSSPWMQTYGNRIGSSSDNPNGDWTIGDRRAAKNRHVKPFDVGQYSFATNDARQFAAWGIDYLKYDWGPVDVDHAAEMQNALAASGRDIVLSLSNNAANNILKIAGDLALHATCWRTTGDIEDTWNSVSSIGFRQQAWEPFQSPGHYNDTDMLVVGKVGWGKLHDSRLTPDEQYTHISLWSLLGSPLLIGCDLDQIDPFTFGLLSNDEVIAIDQDPLCRPATCVLTNGYILVFAKPLEDGAVAVGIFNTGFDDAKFDLDLPTILKRIGPQAARDVWRQKDLGPLESKFPGELAPHGVLMLRISPRLK